MTARAIGTAGALAARLGIDLGQAPPALALVRVYRNRRFFRTLGKWHTGAGPDGFRVERASIELSAVLFVPGAEADLRDTLAHELAHGAVEVEHGTAHALGIHGPLWRSWARKLGAQPSRAVRPTGALKEALSVRLRVVARCERCGFELCRSRRLSPRKRYLHRCGGVFQPTTGENA